MKIRRVSVLTFFRALDGRAWNPAFRWTERRAPLVIVETAAGAAGIGEAWTLRNQCETALQALLQLVSGLAGTEIGHPMDAAARVESSGLRASPGWAQAAARSALDIALWDAYAQEQNRPLWQALGGESGETPAYASGCLYRDNYGEDDLRCEARRYIDRGFQAVKMKIGALDKAADLRRVDAVREAIGPDALLWVDAVNQLRVDSAIDWCASLKQRGVSAIQAPLPASDVEGMAEINRSHMPVIASEAEYCTDVFQSLLDNSAVGHLQYCILLCGGISGASHLDDMAPRHGVPSTPQCCSTSIAQAVTLQFAAARRNVAWAEYHCFHDALESLYRVHAVRNFVGNLQYERVLCHDGQLAVEKPIRHAPKFQLARD